MMMMMKMMKMMMMMMSEELFEIFFECIDSLCKTYIEIFQGILDIPKEDLISLCIKLLEEKNNE